MRTRNPKTICLGPSIITQNAWKQFKREINCAYENWDAWAGGQGNWEEQDEYREMVAKSRAKVQKIIEELERGGK